MAEFNDWLFQHVLTLDMSGDGPPWPLLVFNPTTGTMQRVGGGGGGGEPLVLGDSDPPDFLTTEEGDIIMVEDNRG